MKRQRTNNKKVYRSEIGITNNHDNAVFESCSAICNTGDNVLFKSCNGITTSGDNCVMENCAAVNNSGDLCEMTNCSSISNTGEDCELIMCTLVSGSRNSISSSSSSDEDSESLEYNISSGSVAFGNVTVNHGLTYNGVAVPRSVKIRSGKPYFGNTLITRACTEILEHNPEVVVFLDEWEAASKPAKKRNKPEKSRVPEPYPEEPSASEGQTACNVCQDRAVSAIVRPCNHTICVTCAIDWEKKKPGAQCCHNCRAPYKRIERMYI